MEKEGKKTEKTQSFDLMKIDNKQLVHLDQFEAKLKKLVKDNPFIEITDKATLEIARKRRSALTTARLELRTTGKKESQEGILMKKINDIKDFVKSKIDHLVLIPSTAEDKQDAEIKRYEKILDDAKAEEKRLEDERIDGIKGEIDRVKTGLTDMIDAMTYSLIGQTEVQFSESQTTTVDLMEFAFMFDEMIIEQQQAFVNKIEALKTAENERIENESRSQVAKTNEIYLAVQTKIDEHGMEDDPEALIKAVNDEFDVVFDFGVHKIQFEEKRADYLVKASEKIDAFKRLNIADQKQKIFNVREGLLDMVFQMDPKNHEKVTEYVKEALEQTVIPEVKEDFDKMKSIVEKSLDQKTQLLKTEIDAREKMFADRLDERIKIIEGLGMEANETKDEWKGFELNIFVDSLFDMDGSEFDSFIEEISESKESDENEKEHQQRIAGDKLMMVDLFIQVKDKMTDLSNKDFENAEMVVLFLEIQKEVMELCDAKIDQINKF